MKKIWICNSCGSRIGTKRPERYAWRSGKCSYCNDKSYVALESDFGVNEKKDEAVENIKSLFGTK